MDEWTYNLIMRLEQRIKVLEKIIVTKYPEYSTGEEEEYKPIQKD